MKIRDNKMRKPPKKFGGYLIFGILRLLDGFDDLVVGGGIGREGGGGDFAGDGGCWFIG